MWKATEVSAKPNVKYAKIKNNPPVEPQTEEKIPKPFNTEEPLPSLISDNFNKVKSDKVFAKSCSQPFGNTDACQKKESIKNSLNPWGLFISSAEAMPLAIPPPVISSSATMAAGTQNQSNNDKAARALTQVAGKFKDKSLDNLRFVVETSPVINFSLMLFKALQFSDNTQHTEEELRQMQEVKSRIRVQIIEPEGDDVYPTVRAFHVGDGDDTVPIRDVDKNAQGQYSVTLEEGGSTIYWSPDKTRNQVPHTTPSQDDRVSFDDIWVNPLSDAVNDSSTVLPMPVESDWQDRILVFPEDSGIEPLYLVFKTTARNESGVVTQCIRSDIRELSAIHLEKTETAMDQALNSAKEGAMSTKDRRLKQKYTTEYITLKKAIEFRDRIISRVLNLDRKKRNEMDILDAIHISLSNDSCRYDIKKYRLVEDFMANYKQGDCQSLAKVFVEVCTALNLNVEPFFIDEPFSVSGDNLALGGVACNGDDEWQFANHWVLKVNSCSEEDFYYDAVFNKRFDIEHMKLMPE